LSIIRKTAPKVGWRTTTQIPHRVLTCERCGALCDEATTGEHDSWHEVLDSSTLPLLLDFITGAKSVTPALAPSAEVISPGPSATKRPIALPRLMAADELRRPSSTEPTERSDQIA
jgi:hypothetical protein